MATEANSVFITVHPSQMIEVYGTTDKGRDVRMCLRPTEADALRKTFALEKLCGHLGHAYWHVRNDEPAPCPSCGKSI